VLATPEVSGETESFFVFINFIFFPNLI